MSFANLFGPVVGSLSDPLLWAAMVLVALRVPLRFMLPAAIAATFTMEAVFWMIEAGKLQTFHFDTLTLVGRALAAWIAGSFARIFIERSRQAPIVGPSNVLTG